jgi:hypothetical protein
MKDVVYENSRDKVKNLAIISYLFCNKDKPEFMLYSKTIELFNYRRYNIKWQRSVKTKHYQI